MAYKIYSLQGSWHAQIAEAPTESLATVIAMGLAARCAESGESRLYRVFGPAGFVVAWSAHKGEVREHAEVTIPHYHW